MLNQLLLLFAQFKPHRFISHLPQAPTYLSQLPQAPTDLSQQPQMPMHPLLLVQALLLQRHWLQPLVVTYVEVDSPIAKQRKFFLELRLLIFVDRVILQFFERQHHTEFSSLFHNERNSYFEDKSFSFQRGTNQTFISLTIALMLVHFYRYFLGA